MFPLKVQVPLSGVPGSAAALAVAKSGCRVALIQERSVLGGNEELIRNHLLRALYGTMSNVKKAMPEKYADLRFEWLHHVLTTGVKESGLSVFFHAAQKTTCGL